MPYLGSELEISDWCSRVAAGQDAESPRLAHPRLSNSEAAELYCRWNDHGDLHAKNYLIQGCRRYSIAIALMYCRYKLPLAELIATGDRALLWAIDVFDAQHDRSFLTCAAYRIRLRVIQYVLNQASGAGTKCELSRAKTIRKLRREWARVAILLKETHHTDRCGTGAMRGGAVCSRPLYEQPLGRTQSGQLLA